MKNIIIALLLIAAFACQAQNTIDKQGRRQGHWIKTDKQGVKIYEGDFVDGMETGTFTYYHPNGQVRIRNTYTTPGKVCQHEVYDEQGHLLGKGAFNQKNRDGRWEFYHESGRLIKITHYKMGVRHGQQTIFNAEGDTAEVTNWNDNRRDGRWWKRLGRNGYITATYRKGQIEGRMVEYDQQGLLAMEGNYEAGEREGEFKYYEEGQMVYTVDYKKGNAVDRKVRLLTPGAKFVSIYNINYMVPQGKNKVIVYLSDGSKVTDAESAEKLYGHMGDERFSLVNKEARIMVATDLIVGTTHDQEGREVLKLDPKPDFDIYPDEDCVKMLMSKKLQEETEENDGYFEF